MSEESQSLVLLMLAVLSEEGWMQNEKPLQGETDGIFIKQASPRLLDWASETLNCWMWTRYFSSQITPKWGYRNRKHPNTPLSLCWPWYVLPGCAPLPLTWNTWHFLITKSLQALQDVPNVMTKKLIFSTSNSKTLAQSYCSFNIESHSHFRTVGAAFSSKLTQGW